MASTLATTAYLHVVRVSLFRVSLFRALLQGRLSGWSWHRLVHEERSLLDNAGILPPSTTSGYPANTRPCTPRESTSGDCPSACCARIVLHCNSQRDASALLTCALHFLNPPCNSMQRLKDSYAELREGSRDRALCALGIAICDWLPICDWVTECPLELNWAAVCVRECFMNGSWVCALSVNRVCMCTFADSESRFFALRPASHVCERDRVSPVELNWVQSACGSAS